MKVSVVDLGFNSVKMVNYDVKRDGTFKAYRQEGVKVKLGEGLGRGGYLSGEPVQRTIEALKLFRDVINFDSIRHVLPVATSAVRDAANRDSFLKRVREETGFQFKVLSGEEEGFYSYVGALESTCIPTSLFFDLGGGSLELVYTENYGIKKVESYPLGALRLSKMYGNNNNNKDNDDGKDDDDDGSFSKKAYGKMEERILDTLPDRKELGISVDTTLVGVGGTLRAIARYEQELAGYELDKIHNYRMDHSSVSAIASELYKMDRGDLEKIKAIGSNRVDTIVAGAAVISLLMQKLDFDKVVVSARGLREGILSVFLRDPKAFYSNNVMTAERAKAYVTFACQQEVLPQYAFSLVKPLVSAGLLREKERAILGHALKEMATLPNVTNLSNLFHLIMDEDNAFLTHREQLILALAIVHTKKEKTVDWLFSRYGSILEPQNKKSIEKISACIVLSEILERTKATARLSISGNNNKKVAIRIMQSSGSRQPAVPATLLASALRNFERAFDVAASCQVVVSAANGSASKKHQEVKVIV
ncbi:Ppx/GppA phosphatase family protein [Nitrososphaera viennensis]|uniref:Ppx/GppA family phosphatase n=2 Tax=Nitrososphaera viennensis TaxID=1034015 RepID=A0A977IC53_9ARCH|nr:Ppx/GppA phosphatase family protein [Nitrososphaera viennensis]UVS68279.1 Ppx/GppA family phosphatase [Nitrososphaera viennensis]